MSNLEYLDVDILHVMMSVRVSSRGRVVIPHQIRRKYSIRKGHELRIEEGDGVIRLIVPTKLVDLCETWEIDLEDARKEIEESREAARE